MIKFIKKWLSVIVVIVFILGVWSLLDNGMSRFSPQYLVEQSVLKDKTFSGEVIRITSPKRNIQAYLYPDKTNPIVSVSFIFRKAGTAYVSDAQNGVPQLAAALMTEGAGKYSAQAFNDALDTKGIRLGFNVTPDDFEGEVVFIAKDADFAAVMTNLALVKPRFAPQNLSVEKQKFRTALARQTEHPENVISIQSRKFLYGSHPYARNPLGNANVINSATPAMMKAYLRRSLGLNNLIVGIAGDITPEKAGELLDMMFAGVAETAETKKLPDVKIDFSAEPVNIDADIPQSIAYFYASGTPRLSEDFYPLYAANQIFGGAGLTSELSLLAREKEGLTYSIYSFLGGNDKIDYIMGVFSSEPDKFSRIVEIVNSEWEKFEKYGVSAEKLEQVKNYLRASNDLRYADIDGLSRQLVYIQKEDLGIDFLQKRNDYIRNINLKDVNRVIKKYFTKDNLRFITIGKNKDGGDKGNERISQ